MDSRDTVNKVLIIGVDGCKPDALLAAHTPTFDGLTRGGAYSFKAQTCALTKSGPSWASVLTGVWPDKHGVVNNSIEGQRFDDYPHFFSRLKERQPDVVMASIVHWAPIHEKIVRNADVSSAQATDADVASEAACLLRNGNPDVLFLHFDDVDGAGHRNGYDADVDAYTDAISEVDRLVGRVLEAVRSRKTYSSEDWLIVATTDHGGSATIAPGAAKARHGDDVPEHRTVFVIVNGGEVTPGAIIPTPESVDIAPTVLAHLGVEVDPAWGWEGGSLLR